MYGAGRKFPKELVYLDEGVQKGSCGLIHQPSWSAAWFHVFPHEGEKLLQGHHFLCDGLGTLASLERPLDLQELPGHRILDGGGLLQCHLGRQLHFGQLENVQR